MNRLRALGYGAFAAFLLSGAVAAQELGETGRLIRESTPFEQARPWLILAVMAASFVLSAVALVRTIKREEVKEVEDRIAKVEAQMKLAEQDSKKRDDEQVREIRSVHDRIAAVETHMEHMPTKEALSELQVSVARMQGDVKSTSEGVRSLGAAVTRIENYMLRVDR